MLLNPYQVHALKQGIRKSKGVKSTPNLNPEPSNLEVTTLDDTEWKRYIQGLRDPSGALPFMCNNTNEFQAAWYTLCELSDAKRENDLATWFVIEIPELGDSFYFCREYRQLLAC